MIIGIGIGTNFQGNLFEQGTIVLNDPSPVYNGVEATLSANVTGAIDTVKFYAGGFLVATVLAAPWECAWTPSSTSAITLRAIGYHGASELGSSEVVVTPLALVPETFLVFDHLWDVGRLTVDVSGKTSEQGDSITGLLADKLVQGTAGNRPTHNVTDTDFGGHGSLECLTANSAVRITCAGSNTIVQPYTRILAIKHQNASLGYEVCGSAANNMLQRWTLNRWNFNAGGTAQTYNTPTWQLVQAEIWYVYVNGASTTLEVVRADGTRAGPVTIPATAGTAAWAGENWFSMTGWSAQVKLALTGIVTGAIPAGQRLSFETIYANNALGFAIP